MLRRRDAASTWCGDHAAGRGVRLRASRGHGRARELAASLGATVKLPEIPGGRLEGWKVGKKHLPTVQQSNAVVDGVEVRLEDPEGAPRYMIAVIRGVKAQPSPPWLAGGSELGGVGARALRRQGAGGHPWHASDGKLTRTEPR